MSQSNVPIPFSEPPWLMGLPSPYYNDSHHAWQKAVRAFAEEVLIPKSMDWEAAGDVPSELYQQFAKANMLVPNLGAPLPVEHLKKNGIHTLPSGLKVEDFDYLHTSIFLDELARCGSQGPSGAVGVGFAFGLPPILKFGSKQLQERFVPSILKGEKRICIAVTEPGAGSDVANIETTAVRSKDGKKFIVNGTKKWITNGIFSDYASMAVRTGGAGPGGLSFLVVPLKGQKGVDMRRIKVMGAVSTGTTFIELDDVEVPVENLIGEENKGMQYIMTNFNHERLSIAISTTRLCRMALGSAFEYCLKREAFNKSLMEQPVVRHRLAICGAELESVSAFVEQLVYQLSKLDHESASRELGGLCALVKAHAARVLRECANCAVLLFGGNGLTKSGQGVLVENIYREVPGVQIPGGSEDVLLDLAIRQLVKNYQRKTAELLPASKL